MACRLWDSVVELDSVPPPVPSQAASPSIREASTTSNSTDEDFVDQLFTAFGAEDDMSDDLGAALPEPASVVSTEEKVHQRPDPELMERLSEALAVLPKEMQEQIVDRLIASITSTALFGGNGSATKAVDVIPDKPLEVVDTEEAAADVVIAQTPEEPGMPLAAATLASLLSYYSNMVKHSDGNSNSAVKTIPVIPCHA
jgi:hypothetical protein